MASNEPEGVERARVQPASPRSGCDRSLVTALHNTRVSVFYQDTTLRCVWSENPPSGWIGDVLCGANDRRLVSRDAAMLDQTRRAALGGKGAARLELPFPDEDGVRWFELWIDADDVDGRVKGVVTTAVEITERKRREDALRSLLREVSHRSKNLLAIIQSIANQTGRYSGSVTDFLHRFRGRLQSLASSQDLVTSSNWRGADLHELIAGQVIRFCPDPVRSLRLEGVNPYLNPNAALHVGLALHELSVNAVNHGALSHAGGIVTIGAHPLDEEEGRGVGLVWREDNRRPVLPAANARFGSMALEKVVPSSIGGKATLTIDGTGLLYRLTIPADNYELG